MFVSGASERSGHGVAVIGAGVVGLTTAVLLARRGVRTTLYAAAIDTTASHAACAMWLPFLMGEGSPDGPETDVLNESRRWAEISWSHFNRLEREKCGVHRATWYELFDAVPRRPYYASVVDDFLEGPLDGSAAGGAMYVWTLGTFIIEMPLYMEWLRAEYSRLGGEIVIRRLAVFDELEEHVVFNCSGLGAKELTGDAELTPIGGQLLRLPPAKLTGAVGFGEYCIVPRSDGLIVGSLFLPVEDGASSPSEEVLAGGVRKLRDFLSTWTGTALGSAIGLTKEMCEQPEIERVIGVRPYRGPGARLERQRTDRRSKTKRVNAAQSIYHDYGHGGSGVTFSWGCSQSSIEDYLWNVRQSLHAVNPRRQPRVCDVSIEVGHVEVRTREDLGKVDVAIEESMAAARGVIAALVENSLTYNLCVLIDDKQFRAAARSSLIRELKARLNGLGIDYVCMESELEQVARHMSSAVRAEDRRSIERRLEEPWELFCSQDIFLWYSLRLGLVDMEYLKVCSAVSLEARREIRPFFADRLVSVLARTVAGSEDTADEMMVASYGPEVASACGRVYY